MTFTALAPLLRDGTTVLFSLARLDADRLRVTITPRTPKLSDKPEDAPLRVIDTPIAVEGTPAELDAEIVAKLGEYVEKRNGVAATLTALDAQFEAAKKEADARLRNEKTRGASGGKPVAAVTPKEPASKAQAELLAL